ncbi:MAG TPA: hypothetical protein VFO49_10685 [Nocardioides sp.]|nr:hypothetical protein [Nocardioides sp.]
MAIIHPKSTISPTKLELLTDWLPTRVWAGSGAVEMVASFRFDDPDGEVGIESFVVRCGELLLHVPLTYRGAPLAGADEHLVTTMQHTELGERWVYDAVGDPVAVACFARAVRGEQAQADMELWEDGAVVGRRESAVRLRVEPGSPSSPGDAAVLEVDGGRLSVARGIGDLDGERWLVASWADGEAVVASWSAA